MDMEISSWILGLPSLGEWLDYSIPHSLELMKYEGSSLLLQAELSKTSYSIKQEPFVILSLDLVGFSPSPNTLWSSCPFYLSDKLFQSIIFPLSSQLLEEIINRAPSTRLSSIDELPLLKLKNDLSNALVSHSMESVVIFFDFIFVCRLFWLCACDSPPEVGSLYFKTFAPKLDVAPCKDVFMSAMKSMGGYLELKFMRALGYMYTKLMIWRSLEFNPTKQTNNFSYCYTDRSHGFLVLKGYAPLLAMEQEQPHRRSVSTLKLIETVLKYALAHQQLEGVLQLEYSTVHFANCVRVNLKIDNLRINVSRLVFGSSNLMFEEKHFPSRIRITVGPELGSDFVLGLSLGRSSSGNSVREVETVKTLMGDYAKSMSPALIKATSATTTREKLRNWNCEQDAMADQVIFDMVLNDHDMISRGNRNDQFSKQYLSNMGSLIFAGGEHGEEVCWRLKEVEGIKALTWRVRCKIWLNYLPYNVCKSSTAYSETRSIEWNQEFVLVL